MPCECPLPAAINSLPNVDCILNTDLINRIAFQRLGTPFALLADIQTEANWDTLLAAADDTKIQFSPKFAETEIPASEAITFGGNDNTTPDGEQKIVGEGSVTVTLSILGTIEPELKTALDSLECESDLGVYFIRANNVILASSVDGATDFSPFEVLSFFVSSEAQGGRTEPNRTIITFTMKGSWSEYKREVVPNFDATTKPNP